MFWPIAFGVFILFIVVLKYWNPWGERCPQCQVRRCEEEPICTNCSWIYEVPDEEDEDYGELEEQSI